MGGGQSIIEAPRTQYRPGLMGQHHAANWHFSTICRPSLESWLKPIIHLAIVERAVIALKIVKTTPF